MRPTSAAFGERVAVHYEAWYETPEGRRADELEKGVLRWLLQGFPQVGSVLEIGCGTGHLSRWLHCQGLATVGLDLSAAMLTEAKVLGSESLVQGDALHLPFADDAFDVTAFVTTLEFLTSPRQALGEALRVARRGIILGVLSRWSLLGLQRRLAGLFRPTLYDAAHFYGVGELKRLLRSVAGDKAHIAWCTTLFPRAWPWAQMSLPWGGFIGMALVPSRFQVHRGHRGPCVTCVHHRGQRLYGRAGQRLSRTRGLDNSESLMNQILSFL